MPTLPSDWPPEADGLRLRRLVAQDAPALARIRQDEEMIRWAHPSGSTVSEARSAIAAADEMWQKGEGAEFAITSPENEKLLGTINLKFYGATRASIGFGVAPEARGRGVATRALVSVSEWAFKSFPELVRLELWILVGNDASIQVAQRAGFQREGVLRSRLAFGGELRDVIVFSRLRMDRG